ncbi:MAG TPA: FHA domain-containing protein [Bryobacteraceae bacterium]|nr:FHA domain-containing protein [Bryobacteraceae bacterium]
MGSQTVQPASFSRVRVRYAASEGKTEQVFEGPFRIGREAGCEIRIQNGYVSRVHAEVTYENGQWVARDLKSSNGLYVDGKRVETVGLGTETTIRLGAEGPEIVLAVEVVPVQPQQTPGEHTIVANYIAHYFDDSGRQGPVGEHTMFVRRAFQHVQKKQRRRYGKIMAALAILLVAAAAYGIYEHQQNRKQRMLAENLFYSMKSLDVDIANVERIVLQSPNQQGAGEIKKYQNRRKEMEKNYDRFLATLRVYDPKMTAQERLILRVARIFGECELAMPREFVTEINNYIKKWQSSGRLVKALRTAKQNGYTSLITQDLLDQDLPPQFFYLALQESNFDPYISGPMTRKGIAKGMWQFIPETALKYGLHLGPLIDMRRPDPGDDRHHWDRETKAAAAYLKDLYSTDAQASGLLVMACYNWGEDSVLPLVRSMPENPRERNFWKLLTLHKDKIPQETYDYVFYIASAAVIGEDPHLFGFDFDNPLATLESK